MIFDYPEKTVRVLEYLGYKTFIDYVPSANIEGAISIEWFSGNPLQPADIVAAELPAARAERKSLINADATKRIIAAYPLEKQSSANLGIYPQVYTDKMVSDIASVIAASNTACDAVDAAVDVAGVDAVVVNWPEIGV